jgi:2-polyprenyl-3-methyl-5-hydroxy-6-metoxy-1,4-benzoquinol methylase
LVVSIIKWFWRLLPVSVRFRIKRKVEDWRLSRLGLHRSHGERIYPRVPGTLENLDPPHLFRYEWAKPFCGGKSVLDYGCGIGYGSYILSQVSTNVTGFDISEDALAWAKHYAARAPNLTFMDHPPEDKFDCITCFECIEHVPEPEKLVEWLASHSSETVFISTPEARDDGEMWSRFHEREYSREQFI